MEQFWGVRPEIMSDKSGAGFAIQATLSPTFSSLTRLIISGDSVYMSDVWWYIQNGSRKGPVSLAQAQALENAGVITAETQVWADGMGEWLPARQSPLAKYFADWKKEPPPLLNVAIIHPGSTAPTENSASGREPARGAQFHPPQLSNLLKILMWATIGYLGFNMNFIFRGLASLEQNPHRSAAYFEISSSDWYLAGNLLLSAVTAIVYFLWTYRCIKYARVHAPNIMQMTASSFVWGHFIPVVWFWRPFRGIKQLLAAYASIRHEQADDDLALRWWLSILISFAFALLSGWSAGLSIASPGAPTTTSWFFSGLGLLAEIASAAFFLQIIKRIRSPR